MRCGFGSDGLEFPGWRCRNGQPVGYGLDGIVPWFVLPPLMRSTRIEKVRQVVEIVMVMMMMMGIRYPMMLHQHCWAP